MIVSRSATSIAVRTCAHPSPLAVDRWHGRDWGVVIAPYEPDRVELCNALGWQGSGHVSDPLSVLPTSESEASFGDVVGGDRGVGVLTSKRGVEMQWSGCGPGSAHRDRFLPRTVTCFLNCSSMFSSLTMSQEGCSMLWLAAVLGAGRWLRLGGDASYAASAPKLLVSTRFPLQRKFRWGTGRVPVCDDRTAG